MAGPSDPVGARRCRRADRYRRRGCGGRARRVVATLVSDLVRRIDDLDTPRTVRSPGTQPVGKRIRPVEVVLARIAGAIETWCRTPRVDTGRRTNAGNSRSPARTSLRVVTGGDANSASKSALSCSVASVAALLQALCSRCASRCRASGRHKPGMSKCSVASSLPPTDTASEKAGDDCIRKIRRAASPIFANGDDTFGGTRVVCEHLGDAGRVSKQITGLPSDIASIATFGIGSRREDRKSHRRGIDRFGRFSISPTIATLSIPATPSVLAHTPSNPYPVRIEAVAYP